MCIDIIVSFLFNPWFIGDVSYPSSAATKSNLSDAAGGAGSDPEKWNVPHLTGKSRKKFCFPANPNCKRPLQTLAGFTLTFILNVISFPKRSFWQLFLQVRQPHDVVNVQVGRSVGRKQRGSRAEKALRIKPRCSPVTVNHSKH